MSPQGAARAEARARSARDFYSELIKDTQRGRAAFLFERERWLRSLRVEGREELLFEMEMLLRGVERSFNLHNLPIDPSAGPVVARDFSFELSHVRDAVHGVIRAARLLLDRDADQRLMFRRYLESTVADDRARRALLEEELDQDSPQESLFVLRESFSALRTIADRLLDAGSVSYAVYSDVGNLLLREILRNRYFRPFRPLEFRLEYDRIKSVEILEALGDLAEPVRRLFTVAFLGLFRLLHYLRYVQPDAEGRAAPRARVLLALVRSEAGSLAAFFEDDLATRAELRRHKAAALRAGRELRGEGRRIYREILGDPERGEEAPVEAARTLEGLVKAEIVALSRALEPGVLRRLGNGSAAAAFDALVSPIGQAERLRLDLYALSRLCDGAARALKKRPERGEVALGAVRAYLGYFHGVSYQLLRYGDYEPLDRFAALVGETERVPSGEAQRGRLADDLQTFSGTARGLFTQVSRRRDIAATPFEAAEARPLLARFRAP